MQIKSSDGQGYNVASAATGNTALGLGIAGTALGVLNNGGLGNILGGGWGNYNGGCSENTPVNRYELNLVTALSAKDGEIALLKADKYTDQKIVEAYKDLQGQIKEVASEVRANKDAQTAINMKQGVLNATQTATISSMAQQIAQLQSLSQLVVPQNKVCDTCCNCGCGQ